MTKTKSSTSFSKSKLKVKNGVNDRTKRVATKPIPLPPHVCEALGIPTFNYPARAYPPYFLGAKEPPPHVVNGFYKTLPYMPGVGGDSIHHDCVTASGPPMRQHDVVALGVSSAEGGFQPQRLKFPAVFMSRISQSCRVRDILLFFHGLDVIDVFLVLINKSITVAAFVVFSNFGFVDYALQRDGHKMGGVEVCVLPCSKQDFYKAVASAVDDGLHLSNVEAHTNIVTYTREPEHPLDMVNKMKEKPNSKKKSKSLFDEDRPILRVHGPPYFADKNVINSVFGECDLSEDRIHFVLRPDGKPTGQIFLEFISQEDAMKVLERDKTMLGSRYLKIRPTTMNTLRVKTTEWKQEMDSHDMVKEFKSELKYPGGQLQGKPQKPDDNQKVNTEVIKICNVPLSADLLVADTSDPEHPHDQTLIVCDNNIGHGQPEGRVEVLVNKKEKSKSKEKSVSLSEKGHFILRVYGPPYFSDKNVITSVFGDCFLSEDKIHFVLCPDGKPTGQMFIVFTSQEDAMKVLARDNTMLGSCYLEIRPATIDELRTETTEQKLEIHSHDMVKESSNEVKFPNGHYLQDKPQTPDDKQKAITEVIEISNVPPSADMYDIIELFGEFNLSFDRLHVVCLPNGVSTGAVYVEFDSVEDAKIALSKNNAKIHSNMVQLFPSSKLEASQPY